MIGLNNGGGVATGVSAHPTWCCDDLQGVPHAVGRRRWQLSRRCRHPKSRSFSKESFFLASLGTVLVRKTMPFFREYVFKFKLLLRTLVTIEEPTPHHCDVYC